MKAYLIPKEMRFEEIMILDLDGLIPREMLLPYTEMMGVDGRKFVLETLTDIAVYREREA